MTSQSPRDINALKRADYQRKIAKKEEEIENLERQKKKLADQVEAYYFDMIHSLRRSAMIYDRMAPDGGMQNKRDAAINQEVTRRMSQSTDNLHEKIDWVYKQEKKKLSLEREALSKERSALPWE
ncbi:MAG: hypothetical protein LBI13_07565 [Streptococcaceae bacterium]|jgi:hypothetical protein|nr:hypothetical protein [Streptococcaceae bacterium]